MRSYYIAHFGLQYRDPRGKCSRLFKAALQRALKIEQVPIEPLFLLRAPQEPVHSGGDTGIEDGLGRWTAGPVLDFGSFPTRRRRQSGSAPPSKILRKTCQFATYPGKEDTYRVPSILTPCRCAAVIQPCGGMVTR